MNNAYSPYSYPTRNNTVVNQRKSLRWFLYLIILAAGGFGISFYFSSLGEKYSVKLLSKEGGIEYRENNSSDWREVEKLPLESNVSYEIRTLADGKAKLNSSDGSELNMGNFARLVLLKNQGELSWAQTDGEVRYLVEKNEKRKSFNIILSDGEVEVLGTDFVVKVEEKDTTVYVYKGRIKLVYKDKSAQEAGENEKIIINPLEKKVVAFEEKDFSSNLREETALPPEIKENLVPVSNDNQPAADNSNVNSGNTNTNAAKDESISISEEKKTNSNTNNGNTNSQESSITSSATKEESSTPQEVKTSTSAQASVAAKKTGSGKTTRSKCEDSGGHWTKEGSLCKCPPGENFTGGKCKR